MVTPSDGARGPEPHDDGPRRDDERPHGARGRGVRGVQPDVSRKGVDLASRHGGTDPGSRAERSSRDSSGNSRMSPDERADGAVVPTSLRCRLPLPGALSRRRSRASASKTSLVQFPRHGPTGPGGRRVHSPLWPSRLTDAPSGATGGLIPAIRLINLGSCPYLPGARRFFAVLRATAAPISPAPAHKPLVRSARLSRVLPRRM